MLVKKRDNSLEQFALEKIEHGIKKAFEACHAEEDNDVLGCIKNVYNKEEYTDDMIIDVEDIQDNVETCLMSINPNVAKEYIIYRYNHKVIREAQSKLTKQLKKKLTAEDVQNQNANVDEYSFGGRMGEATSLVTKQYALDYCMSRKSRNNHNNNEIYIHDLDSYAVAEHNCLTVPFDELLSKTVKTRQTDIRPANSINTAFQLIAVYFQIQSLQQFGGVSSSHLDWTMVPYVRKSFFNHFSNCFIENEAKKENIILSKLPNKERKAYKKQKRAEFKEKYKIQDEKFSIGDFSMDCINFHVGDENIKTINEEWYEKALNATIEELDQSVEGLYHNLNSLQSRSGCQLECVAA